MVVVSVRHVDKYVGDGKGSHNWNGEEGTLLPSCGDGSMLSLVSLGRSRAEEATASWLSQHSRKHFLLSIVSCVNSERLNTFLKV